MAELSNMIDAGTAKVKSFWERPEGTTGMITLALFGLGAFFILSAFGPVITGGLTALSGIVSGLAGLTLKTAYLVVNGALLTGLILVLTNKKFLTLTSYVFKSLMRMLTGWFVEIDPIGIMKNYIDTLNEKKELLDDRISKLNGQIKICERQIEKNKTNQAAAMQTAKVARDRVMAGDTRMQNQFTLNARNAGRLQKSNLTLEDLLKRMTFIYTALQKYRDAADVVIQDLTAEVEVKSEERKAIMSGVSAIRAAKSILMGGGDQRELFDQAMEFVVNDYGQKLGEIENFMTDAQPFIDGLDLQNGVYEENALEQLKAWSEKADSILLGSDKIQMIEHFDNSNRVPLSAAGSTPVVTGGDDFHKLFNK